MSEYIDDELWHEGVLRKSGRYPWGSGETPYQRSKSFLGVIEELEKKGLSPTEIVTALGIDYDTAPGTPGGINSTGMLRSIKSQAKGQIDKDDLAQIRKYQEKGLSNVAIGELMNRNESSIRALIAKDGKLKADATENIANQLKDHLKDGNYLDIGAGTENHLSISKERLNIAVARLKEEGYEVHTIKEDQNNNTGNKTTYKVLVPPGTEYRELRNNTNRIKSVAAYSEDNGQSFSLIKPPVFVDAKRVGVRYAEDGGAKKDGVIELRRGVDDISLGRSQYAQVRIAVEGGKYLKGMAMYSDNLPDGVDLLFNTNKSDTGNKLDAMKDIKKDKETGELDPDLPFGSIVRQKMYMGKDGKPKQSILNIVGTPKPDSEEVTSGEEGGWSTWSRTLSSQMLSKQKPELAKQQLGLAYDKRKEEYDEIMSLTNPVVKKKLLESFADGADSAAVHLKAAGLPRTANHVLLPINSLKDNEIYAPNYNDGEKVVLIRHPHGGIFEIPELTVNNRNREANSVMKNAKDAVGINANVAERLSGADFDGDTVLVIPNAGSGPNRVQNSPPLKGLQGFDAKALYKLPDDVPKMKSTTKQQQMGDVSNLITDMTIKGATEAELARAVRHSMVVIDAEKHHLDYKQSARDHGIKELKAKYQLKPDGKVGGSATLISRAKSDVRVPVRKARSAQNGGPVDLATGKKMYEPVIDKKTGLPSTRTIKSTKMAETDDARTLLSTNGGQRIERVYADHANKLKAIANTSRKAAVTTKMPKREPSAAKAYAPEVASLKEKLNTAQLNSPRERQALLVAKQMVDLKRQANPDMDKDELKKVKNLAMAEARARTGAKKKLVDITPREWQAIQANAVSSNMLENILVNADLDQVKQLAMPREATVMLPAKVRRAQAMLANGQTQAEVAAALGVPVSTLNSSLEIK